MLKWLIMLLLVFCVLSLYNKNIKKYFRYIKKAIYINIVVSITVIMNIISGYSNVLINNVYLACKYDSQLEQYASYAQDAMRDYGVYASLILAQIIIESGFGAHQSSFGVKIPGVRCPDEASVCASKGGKCMSTKEEVGGKMVSTQACFEISSSGIGETIYDHGKFLTEKFGNRNELKNASSLEGQLKSLKSNPNAQYATSSNYLCSLVDQINACDLTKYDAGVSGGNISGSHTSLVSRENCGVIEQGITDPDNPYAELVEPEYSVTSYEGELTEGWLYLRSRAYEDPEDKLYEGPDMLDDAIDEIFYRARITYTQNIEFGQKKYANYASLAEMLMETIPQDLSELMDNYWYTFDIDSYLGNTLFGQCVWYAKHRALEIIDNSGLDDSTKQILIESIKKTSGNGQDWYNNPDGSLFQKSSNVNEPRPGAIVSWSHGEYGHVAIVESVYEKNGETMLTISEGSRIKHDTDGDGKVDGWISSSTLEHALSQTKIETKEVPLSQMQNRWGYSFNGYVYLLDEG